MCIRGDREKAILHQATPMGRVIIFPSSISRRNGQWAAFVLVVATIGTLLFLWNKPAAEPDGARSGSPSPADLSGMKPGEASLTIDFGEAAARRRFSGAVIDGMSVADALFQAGLAGNFEVVLASSGMPERIDGVSGEWEAERNGEPIQSSLATASIAPGDEVLLRPAEVH